MKIKITPGPLKGTIPSITSKSHAHRLFIGAALCHEECRVPISDWNEDLEATQSCLSQLGKEGAVFHCGESGSTLRFLLPVAMALTERAVFMGGGRLPQRPLSPLKEEMEAHGCKFVPKTDLDVKRTEGMSLTEVKIAAVEGRLRGGNYRLPGNISSQYITGLLFALPLLSQNSSIQITSPLESKGYLRLTLDVLALFGIKIQVKSGEDGILPKGVFLSFEIIGNQKYQSPGEVTAEGDWSSAAFWVAADVLSRKRTGSRDAMVFCENLENHSAQRDKDILLFADSLADGERSTAAETLMLDVANVPDLVPILAVLAAAGNQRVEFTHGARLRLKESDRLASVREMLESLGGNVTELPEGLIIEGTGRLRGGTVNGYNDHRIVMAGAIASILCEEPVTILGGEAVDKSYPGFWKDFAFLGGEYHVM